MEQRPRGPMARARGGGHDWFFCIATSTRRDAMDSFHRLVLLSSLVSCVLRPARYYYWSPTSSTQEAIMPESHRASLSSPTYSTVVAAVSAAVLHVVAWFLFVRVAGPETCRSSMGTCILEWLAQGREGSIELQLAALIHVLRGRVHTYASQLSAGLRMASCPGESASLRLAGDYRACTCM